MGEDREPRRVYAPSDVAERLGVSGQRLRQLAKSYERVFGELPRDQRGRAWPEESVEELERARNMVQLGLVSGIEQALRGELMPGGAKVPPTSREPSAGDIAAVAGELRALREVIEEQNRIMEGMTRVLENQGRRLEALEGAALEVSPADPTPSGSPTDPVPTSSPAPVAPPSTLGRLQGAVRRWWRAGGA